MSRSWLGAGVQQKSRPGEISVWCNYCTHIEVDDDGREVEVRGQWLGRCYPSEADWLIAAHARKCEPMQDYRRSMGLNPYGPGAVVETWV